MVQREASQGLVSERPGSRHNVGPNLTIVKNCLTKADAEPRAGVGQDLILVLRTPMGRRGHRGPSWRVHQIFVRLTTFIDRRRLAAHPGQ